MLVMLGTAGAATSEVSAVTADTAAARRTRLVRRPIMLIVGVVEKGLG